MKRTYSKTPQNKEQPQPVISSRVGRLINGGGIKHAAVAAGNHFWKIHSKILQSAKQNASVA